MPDHMLPFAFGLVFALVPQCAVALNRRLSLRSPTSMHRKQECDARRTHSRVPPRSSFPFRALLTFALIANMSATGTA
eukprot:1893886-Pleurochrysis_carterae.AAC.1